MPPNLLPGRTTARAAVVLAVFVALVATALQGCARELVRVVDSPAPLGWRAPVLAAGTVPLKEAIQPIRVEIFRAAALSDGRVRLVVNVVDSAGRLVSGLEDADALRRWCALVDSSSAGTRERPFTVRERSGADTLPVALVLALDHSGSMGEERTRRLQQAANDLLRIKRRGDAVGVVKFDGSSDLHRELTESDRDLPVVGSRGFGGETAMFDACRLALEHAIDDSPAESRTAGVVLLTDGDDNASRSTAKDIIDLARSHAIPVFTVSFGPWLACPSAAAIRDISAQTGGRSYRVYSREDFSPVFADVLRRMQSHYVVEYRAPESGWHRVSLRDCRNDSIVAVARFESRHDLAPIPPLAALTLPPEQIAQPQPPPPSLALARTGHFSSPELRIELVRRATLDGRSGRLYRVSLTDSLLDPNSIGIYFPLSEFIRPDMIGDADSRGSAALRRVTARLSEVISTMTHGRCAVLVQGHADVGFGPGRDDVPYRTIRGLAAADYLEVEPAARALLGRRHPYHVVEGDVVQASPLGRLVAGPGYTNRELAFLRGAFVRARLESLGTLGTTPILLVEGIVQQIRDPRLRSATLYLFEADDALVLEGETTE